MTAKGNDGINLTSQLGRVFTSLNMICVYMLYKQLQYLLSNFRFGSQSVRNTLQLCTMSRRWGDGGAAGEFLIRASCGTDDMVV